MTNNQAPGHLSPSLPRLYRPGRYPRIPPRESRERPSATERLAKLREISRAIVSSDSSLAFRHNELRVASRMHLGVQRFAKSLMFKIQRRTQAGTVTLTVIGRMGGEQVPDLQRLVSAGSGRDLVLDLTELTLVDTEVVRFLMQCQTQGVRLTNCPAYIRQWMVRESAGPDGVEEHVVGQISQIRRSR